MTTLHALRHASSALHHAEVLADEAEDLGADTIAKRLRDRAADVQSDMEAAMRSIENITPAAEARRHAHDVVCAVYAEVTLRLEHLFKPEVSARFSPGGHLDITERMRFRLRHLPPDGGDALLDIRTMLERAIFGYDNAVDDYLLACAEAQSRKDRAIVKSQALRLELERAKNQLLLRAPAGSEVYRRIKRRAVRTKRARWLDEARAQRLLGEAFA